MCIKKFLIFLFALSFTGFQVNAKQLWDNHLRTNFLNNSTVIYAINIRTFNAQDTNRNGIIDFSEGEISGNFINAINRLDELKQSGINTIHVLPITPTGKIKALGTAGSLYSAAGFNTVNPQLKDHSFSSLTVEQQAKKFVEAAHSKGISVIVDVPACGSYDLFLQHPELFVKDASGQPVVPSDWTDVRLLNAGDENNVNSDVLNLYKEFVDLMQNLGVDGIRADVAHSKPAKFWKELIDYSRKKDPEFLWLAESSDSWKDAVSSKAVFTPYDKLLEAGFDGYYGSYFNLKNWKNAKELKAQVELNLSLEKKTGAKKSVIGSFATHDELSPMLDKGRNYSKMIIWLNATLPLNSYFVDGFDTGDKYIYFWANKKADETFTDDDTYFVHRGKIDIFNFSRKPGGGDSKLQQEFVNGNNLKKYVSEIYKNGEFRFLSSASSNVFAYAITNSDNTVIVIGNLDFKSGVDSKVSVPKLKADAPVMPMNYNSIPEIKNGKIESRLEPGEIQVLIFDNFSML